MSSRLPLLGASVLVLGACSWVSFDDPGRHPRADAGLDASGDGDADGDADAGAACTPACEDGFVCSAGDCVDEHVDADGDTFPVSVDCDDHDEEVVPGSTRPCETACGEGVETCQEGGWGACSAPEDCGCSPAETREEPCGRCGTALRACGPEGTWGALGPCLDEGECSARAEEVTACPEDPCSTRRRTCTDECAWGAYGACEGGGDDLDGDGHVAEACGGDDCDDGDARVHPGRLEDEDWAAATVDADGDTGWESALSIDANGALHVSYRDETADVLRYATDASGVWQTATIDADGDTGYWISIAVDASGAAHVTTMVCNGANGSLCYDGDLRYATNAGGAWEVDTIDEGGDTGYSSSVGIDGAGAVHVTYRECMSTNGGLCYDGDLRHATNASGAWQAETIDDAGDTGYSTALAIGSNGDLHVSYVTCAGSNGGLCYDGDLQYATDASGAFRPEAIESEGDTGEGTSIALDAAGAVHVGYQVCNGSNGGFGCYDADLRAASNAGGAWATEELDAEGDTGYWPSLRFDAAEAADVAYYDWDRGDLRFATNASGVWVAESLDADGDTGAFTSLATSDALLAVSYYDATNGDLRVMRRSAPNGIDDDCDGRVW